MKSFKSSSPQSNRSTTSSAPSRLSWRASLFIISERAVDTLLAQKLIVALYRLHPCRGKRFGAQHAHLKPTRFLPKKNWSFFNWFRHAFTSLSVQGNNIPIEKATKWYHIPPPISSRRENIYPTVADPGVFPLGNWRWLGGLPPFHARLSVHK